MHFFWGSFDMAVTRFSGRPAPPHPGARRRRRQRHARSLFARGQQLRFLAGRRLRPARLLFLCLSGAGGLCRRRRSGPTAHSTAGSCTNSSSPTMPFAGAAAPREVRAPVSGKHLRRRGGSRALGSRRIGAHRHRFGPLTWGHQRALRCWRLLTCCWRSADALSAACRLRQKNRGSTSIIGRITLRLTRSRNSRPRPGSRSLTTSMTGTRCWRRNCCPGGPATISSCRRRARSWRARSRPKSIGCSTNPN